MGLLDCSGNNQGGAHLKVSMILIINSLVFLSYLRVGSMVAFNMKCVLL